MFHRTWCPDSQPLKNGKIGPHQLFHSYLNHQEQSNVAATTMMDMRRWSKKRWNNDRVAISSPHGCSGLLGGSSHGSSLVTVAAGVSSPTRKMLEKPIRLETDSITRITKSGMILQAPCFADTQWWSVLRYSLYSSFMTDFCGFRRRHMAPLFSIYISGKLVLLDMFDGGLLKWWYPNSWMVSITHDGSGSVCHDHGLPFTINIPPWC